MTPDELQEAMMGPRKLAPGQHPKFEYHNCWRCKSGEKPCVQGNPNQCEYPHARND